MKDVAKAAAEFLADLPNLVAARQAVDKARLGLKKSIEGVDKAKIACLEANSKLRGRLQVRFPKPGPAWPRTQRQSPRAFRHDRHRGGQHRR